MGSQLRLHCVTSKCKRNEEEHEVESQPLSVSTDGSQAAGFFYVSMLSRLLSKKGGHFLSVWYRRIMVFSYNNSSEFSDTAMKTKTVTVSSSRPPPGELFRVNH